MDELSIKNLTVEYLTTEGTVHAVNDVSFSIKEGETLGLVGETGAGKTSIALSILKLIPDPPGKIQSGEILLEGRDVLNMKPRELREMRGGKVSMIFQDPMTSLNPVLTVGEQIAENIRYHSGCSKAESREKTIEMLGRVGIPHERMDEYPYQFSGGMRQRVVIAIALACYPKLLIADEPTSALDVTIQAQVLDLIRQLKEELNTSVLLITHDLGVVAETCDKVAVMYAGEIVEYGTLRQVFKNTMHPYTKGLFDSLPSLDKDTDRLKPIEGMMPDPTDLPQGCSFMPRCPYATEKCRTKAPGNTEAEAGHLVRCWLLTDNEVTNIE